MNKITTRIATALLMCALTSVAASAKVTSRTITFGQDFVFGGTAVKHGTYRVSFDDATNELTLADRKTKEVVARASASAEARKDAARGMDIQWVNKGGAQVFASIAFHGEKQVVSVKEGGMTAATTGK